MAVSERLLQAIAVTAELTGTALSEVAARVMAQDLARYPEAWVFPALVRCRRELRSRMTLAEVLARIEDGRPGPEEAWALIPKDEAKTSVWTDEMREAYAACGPLLAEGDAVAARMAFKEAYAAAVQKARDAATPPTWTATLGHDPHGREHVLLEAVARGRLTLPYAQKLLPHLTNPTPQLQALIDAAPKRLTRAQEAA
ncbi:MAG: hypothetical protein ACM3SS_02685 [Rhodospirillaceae bacterium]